jgi:hypothetical protein
MKRIITLFIVALSFGGCVSKNMNEGLQSLMGQNIHAAIDRIGYPDVQQVILGDKVYVWGVSQNAVMPMTNTNFTSGSVGGVPVYGTTTSTSYVPVNYNCKIQIATDANDIMKRYQWSGNMGGCAHYANALKP